MVFASIRRYYRKCGGSGGWGRGRWCCCWLWGCIPAGRGIGIDGNGGPGEKVDRLLIKMLQEGNMEGVEYASICCVPESISFCMRSVADEDAGTRAMIDFQIVCLDEGEHSAANFTKMGEGRNLTCPEFVRCLSIECGGSS